MAKLKVKLTEMKDASVSFVSLVDRSASRMPIRVMKADQQENRMLDLTNPGALLARVMKGQKKADPVITAVVTMDHGDELMPKVTEVLQAQGFAVDKVTKNEDGTVMFAQEDNPTEGASLFRLSDDVLVVVKGFDSSCWADGKAGDFTEQMASRGFMPGVSVAMDVLYSAVSDALYSSASAADAQAAISSTVQKFSAYVGGLAKGLPSKAFKAEKAVGELLAGVQKAAKKPDTETGAAEGKAHEAAEGKAHEAAEGAAAESEEDKVKKAEAALAEEVAKMAKPAKVSQEDWDKMSPADKKACVMKAEADAAEEAAKAQKSEAEKMAETLGALTKAMEGLVQKMDALGTSTGDQIKEIAGQVTALKASVETSERKVDEAVKKADTAAQTLQNTVLAAPPAADVPTALESSIRKNEKTTKGDLRQGTFDTAFLPNRGRPASN